MSGSYNNSTRMRIADINGGLRVKTGVLLNTVYAIQAQVNMFNVYGRVQILNLYGEIIVVMSATATTLKFNATWTTPTVAAANITAASGSMTGQKQGVRVYCVGGAVATAAVITASQGISDINVTPIIIGMKSGVGTIGQLTAGANGTSGSIQYFVHYIPMSEGAYISSIL